LNSGHTLARQTLYYLSYAPSPIIVLNRRHSWCSTKH
jgi:hypothetical protein